MLKQLKDQLARFKTENSRLKEQLVELEDKIEDDARNAKNVPQDWEAERERLQGKIESLQNELQSSSTKLDSQMQAIRQELADARRERDNASHNADEASRLLSSSKKDLEQLQQENVLLERRAQDAEQKVTLLLDQVETSVDSYRRRSKQRLPSLQSESSNIPAPVAPTNGAGHVRQVSSEAGSLYDGPSNARDSTALDNLANELETLRSHWEATNKNYRLSNTFDFEPGTPTPKEETGLGLSESLADWRKRLDEDPQGPGAAK
jgi:DNA repair exonuclease SbcCD ATPase subunit